MRKSRSTEAQIVGILKDGALNRERVHRVCRACDSNCLERTRRRAPRRHSGSHWWRLVASTKSGCSIFLHDALSGVPPLSYPPSVPSRRSPGTSGLLDGESYTPTAGEEPSAVGR